MICPNCGQSVREGADYCGKCGNPLKTSPSVKICPTCHAKVRADNVFCTECGFRFSQENNMETQEDLEGWNSGYEKEGGRRFRLPVILSLVVFLIFVVGAGFIYYVYVRKPGGKSDYIQKLQEMIAEEEDDVQSNGLEQKDKDETESLEEDATSQTSSLIDNSELSESINLDLEGLGAEEKTYPLGEMDFVDYSDDGGVYSFVYPKNFFKSCHYSSNDKCYTFKTADEYQILRIYEEEASIKNDPKKSAQEKLETVRQEFDLESDQMFIYESKNISDTGYYRTIITGPDRKKEGLGHYYVYACTNEKTYTMSYDYYYIEDDEYERSLNGYLTDCLYRGWSISGSSYKLRSYELFKKDDMGEKK